MLLTVVVWSAFAEVEIVVTAPAAARPASGIAELRAPDTRSVARVMVEQGQPVAAGDAIIVLESRLLEAQRRSAAQALEARRRALADARAAAQMLENGASADLAPTPRARLRVVEHRSRLAQLDAELRAVASELETSRTRGAALRRQLAIRSERYRAAQVALDRGALSHFDMLRARQELLAQRADLDAVLGHVDVLRERLSAQRNVRQGVEAGHRETLMETVAVLEVEVAELETRLAEVDEQRRQGHIAAPIDGVVDQILVAAGDFVQRGEPLGVVVPEDAAVLFETRIAPRQAAFLHTGQACRIKLDSLPFARYGALPCTVALLGRDVVEGGDGPGHYLARVRPAAQELQADGEVVRLQPGATAWVDIIAGRRTVLSFFTEPLRRFARESLRER